MLALGLTANKRAFDAKVTPHCFVIDAKGNLAYKGAIDCVVQTMRHEGPRAFYQGVVPQFFRLTGWSIVMFVSFEQLKLAAARAGAA